MVYRVHGFGVTDVQQVLQGRGKKKRTATFLRISSESPSGVSSECLTKLLYALPYGIQSYYKLATFAKPGI